ncbi:MAG: hypothetical protein ACOCW2_01865 [Chitinivibrionales bacterium]
MQHLPFLRACIAIAVGAFLFTSCTDNQPVGADIQTSGGTGEAVVQLPDIPEGFLAKRRDSSMVFPRTLTLLITGYDMDTMVHRWSFDSMPDGPVVIDGIAAGYPRIFEGYLTNSNGTVTHSGKVPVRIVANGTVNVHLTLDEIDHEGSAAVCIEIEGLPSSCGRDTSTTCYEVALDSTYGPDGYLNGHLKITTYGDSVFGELSVAENMYNSFLHTYYLQGSVNHDSVYLLRSSYNDSMRIELEVVSDYPVLEGSINISGSWRSFYGYVSECPGIPTVPDTTQLPDTTDTILQYCYKFVTESSPSSPESTYATGYLSVTSAGLSAEGTLVLYHYNNIFTEHALTGYVDSDTGMCYLHAAAGESLTIEIQLHLRRSYSEGMIDIDGDGWCCHPAMPAFFEERNCGSLPMVPDTLLPPDPNPDDTILQCFSISGQAEDSATFTGDFRLWRSGSDVHGYMRLSGFEGCSCDRYVTGVYRAVDDTTNTYTLRTVADTIQGGPFDIMIDEYPRGVFGYIKSQPPYNPTVEIHSFTGRKEVCNPL